MAKSSHHSDHPPFQQLQAVVDLLESPTLARLYMYTLEKGSSTVSEIVSDLDIPQGTAYDYIGTLEQTGLVTKVHEQRPYEYEAVPVSLTFRTDGSPQTITPALIAAIARREENADIDVFFDRHGLDALSDVLTYAEEYVEGTVNHRIAARELDLSPLEAEIILQALEPIAKKYLTDSK
ncbi:DUF7437 domain-containing protein [Halocatena pleomorpha]|uniref:ArsR family transcriptional regulator n=1 Tax=Halocatena pleomorpha TaxID=1785090 RepID=A0A3P3R267_9EURY|nr:helix-turn-helix domain-containing protein [Halocatena pleomorpha]RRJ27572.1 ArsR family transcriptional regulator [Halocatena pleomorpha]